MKRPLKAHVLLALGALVPVAALAQETPPANLATVELARSRTCVGTLARLAELNAELEPFARRAERIRALNEAVALEDSARAAPFDATDPLEEAVRLWFASDAELARRFVTEGDEALQQQRSDNRAELHQRLQDAMAEVAQAGQERVAAAGLVNEEARSCDGAIFVRSAVLEACETTGSPLCEQARANEGDGRVRFVDAPEDLWNVEQHRPWTDPTPLQVTQAGGIGGARTAVRSRRGNVALVVGVAPMIRERSEIGEERAAEFDANLDSLGFTFEHSRLVMAPAFEVQLDLPEPLGGETHYVLHFGDLSDPANQVVWSLPASSGLPFQAVFPAAGGALARLQAGEALSLTAVRVPEGAGAEGEEVEGEAVFTLALTPVNQASAVAALLSYMGGGQLSRDLAALVPPTQGGS